MIKSTKSLMILSCFMLSGCASWDEEFEGKVVRAYPQASIHAISTMTDRGLIKENDDFVVSGDLRTRLKVFKDGDISRGVEDVRRMYVMTYEDASKNLHLAHHLYLVVRPAEWKVATQNGGSHGHK